MALAPSSDSSGISSVSDTDTSPPLGIPPLYPPSANSTKANSSNARGNSETAQSRRLVELLRKASLTIKAERARVADLQRELEAARRQNVRELRRVRAENDTLRAENESLRAQRGPPESGYSAARRARAPSAAKSQSQSRGEGRGGDGAKGQSQSRGEGRGGDGAKGQSQSRGWGRGGEGRGGDEAKGQSQGWGRGGEGRGRDLDFGLSPPGGADAARAVDSADSSGEGGADEEEVATRAAAEEMWRVPPPNASPYCAGMISRLRRAMAPLPTREQLGEVIHAMVKEIVRDARRRGIDLRMTRQAPCVYRCMRQTIGTPRKNASRLSRVLHLSIDSGRLTVKLGGGHENLLEYLERHHYFNTV